MNNTPHQVSSRPTFYEQLRTDPAGLLNDSTAKTQFIFFASMLQDLCHGIAAQSGWWTDLKTGASLRSPNYGATGNLQPGLLKINVPEKLMLIVSEIAEAMEGVRKNLKDDKLPHRPMLEVELADAVIRILDLAGGIGLDVPAAIVEKLVYNSKRADHKPENRKADGGKTF